MLPGHDLSIADIVAAADRIAGSVERTPCAVSRTLSQITGAEVTVKFENLQYTASFKERGALNRLLTLDGDERARGVVAMSAGNHAQGLAYHATRLGIAATVVMPTGTPMVKVGRTRALGANVIVAGETLADAHAIARTFSADHGAVFVPPYDCPVVMAGQGTVVLELLEQAPDLDAIIVPVGGGGLLAGAIVAAGSVPTDVEIVGVQVASHAALHAALAAGAGVPAAVPGGDTVAEGIAVAQPSARAVRIARRSGCDVLVVDDEHIEEAMVLYLEVEKVVAEGAGAAPLAALLAHPERFAGRRVALLLTGGNADLRVLASALLRSLARSGRLSTLSVLLPDKPGALHALTGVLATHGANVVELIHDRIGLSTRLRSAQVGVQIETADRDHLDEVLAALAAAGFTVLP
jgi:threonine dehydratase